MNKVIVTGVNGFVGAHLVDSLLEDGYEITGVGREPEARQNIAEKLGSYRQCDLADYSQVDTLQLSGVVAIINLAGLAAVGPSFDQPDLYMRINTSVLDSVCKAAIKQSAKLRIISISSGAVYKSQQTMPLTESSQLDKGSSPYAASKIAMEELSLKYREQGLDCVIVRPFNHIGPGQLPGFILPDLCQKIMNLPEGQSELAVGNLSTKRDYTDVRDVVRAYVAIVKTPELPQPVYNVCTGRSLSGEYILQELLKVLDREDVTVRVDESLFRPSDAQDLYGDSSLLRNDTGWQPTTEISQTIRDFVESKR